MEGIKNTGTVFSCLTRGKMYRYFFIFNNFTMRSGVKGKTGVSLKPYLPFTIVLIGPFVNKQEVLDHGDSFDGYGLLLLLVFGEPTFYIVRFFKHCGAARMVSITLSTAIRRNSSRARFGSVKSSEVD